MSCGRTIPCRAERGAWRQGRVLAGLAILLMVLLLSPSVSLPGTWASPLPVGTVESDSTLTSPAELAPATGRHLPREAAVVMAVTAMLTLLLLPIRPPRAFTIGYWSTVEHPPGRRGRARLYAYLH